MSVHKLHVTAVAQWLRSLVRSQLVSLEFFIDIKSFRSHYGPGVDSAPNRNEYQEYFLGVKGGRCLRLTTLPPSCAVVTKSGNLNFLEPSGPVTRLLYLLQKLQRAHVQFLTIFEKKEPYYFSITNTILYLCTQF